MLSKYHAATARSLLGHYLQDIITVLIGYYDFHPVTKSTKIGSYDYSKMSF